MELFLCQVLDRQIQVLKVCGEQKVEEGQKDQVEWDGMMNARGSPFASGGTEPVDMFNH